MKGKESMGRKGKVYDREYSLEVFLISSKLLDNIKALEVEHPVEVDAMIAEALLAVADKVSETTCDMHWLIMMSNALKKAVMELPGLMNREDLCQVIDDIIYQHTPEEGEREEQK